MAVNTAIPDGGLGIPALQPDATGGFDDVERSCLESHPGRIRHPRPILTFPGQAFRPRFRRLRAYRPRPQTVPARPAIPGCARPGAVHGAGGTVPGPARASSAPCCSGRARSPGDRLPRRTHGPRVGAGRAGDAAASPCRRGHRRSRAARQLRPPSAIGTIPAAARRSGRARATSRLVCSAGSTAQAGSPSTRRSAPHCWSVATAMATQQSSRPHSSGPATWYTPCGAAAGPRFPPRESTAP